IHALVDEYDMGVQDKDNLEFKTQWKAYLAHMLSHQNFLIKNMRHWVMIQEQMPIRTFTRAGALYSTITNEIEKNMIPEDEIMSDNPSKEEVSTWKDKRAKLNPQAHNAQVPGTWGGDDEPDGPQELQDGPQGDGLQDRPQEGGLQDRHNRDQAEQGGLGEEVIATMMTTPITLEARQATKMTVPVTDMTSPASIIMTSAGPMTPTPGPIMRELWPTKLNTRMSM
ncbi:hypothetical protein FRC11_013035, partial [Ceratobasidium sp. 423]